MILILLSIFQWNIAWSEGFVTPIPGCTFSDNEKEVAAAERIAQVTKVLKDQAAGTRISEVHSASAKIDDAAKRYLEAVRQNDLQQQGKTRPEPNQAEKLTQAITALNDNMDLLFKAIDRVGDRKLISEDFLSTAFTTSSILSSTVFKFNPEVQLGMLGLKLAENGVNRADAYFKISQKARNADMQKRLSRAIDFDPIACTYHDLLRFQLYCSEGVPRRDKVRLLFTHAQREIAPQIREYMTLQTQNFPQARSLMAMNGRQRQAEFDSKIAPVMKACYMFGGAYYFNGQMQDPFRSLNAPQSDVRKAYGSACDRFRCANKSGSDVGLAFFEDYMRANENLAQVATVQDRQKREPAVLFKKAPPTEPAEPYERYLCEFLPTARQRMERQRNNFLATGDFCMGPPAQLGVPVPAGKASDVAH